MKSFTFQINEVQTHNQRELGNHVSTKDSISVLAENEEFARSLARIELRKRTPGVQKYQPGVCLKVEELPKAAPAPAKA